MSGIIQEVTKALQVAVPFIHNNGKMELAVSLARSQREQCRPIRFIIEKALAHFPSGEHQLCINYIERSLAPNNWIISGSVLTVEKPFVAKGLCSTDSTLLLGRWSEFLPWPTEYEIKIPDKTGLKIVKGPPKWDFFTSLFGHTGEPSRITDFVIIDENGNQKECECMITAIERIHGASECLFKTQIRFGEAERYTHAIGRYSTKKHSAENYIYLI